MDNSPTSTRLSAIIFTDIVGFSKLSEINENLAMEILKEHNSIVRDLMPEFEGKEIKTLGDGFFMEFHSAINAVKFSLELQSLISEYNESVEKKSQFKIRIGIHLGDVIDTDNDVYGETVNIASRIVAIAEPGGIIVTQQVFDQINGKIQVKVDNLGSKHLKNITKKIRLLSLHVPTETASLYQGKRLEHFRERLSRVIPSKIKQFYPESRGSPKLFYCAVGLGTIIACLGILILVDLVFLSSARLVVTTNPQNTILELDEKPFNDGKYTHTPIVLKDLSSGRHVLKISREGYRPIRFEFNIKSGQLKKRRFKLYANDKFTALQIINSQKKKKILFDINDGFHFGFTPENIRDLLADKGYTLKAFSRYDDKNNYFLCNFSLPRQTARDLSLVINEDTQTCNVQELLDSK